MNEMVNTQTLLFLESIQIGILLAIIYDFLRIARKAVPHPNWLVQLEDLLYWILGIGISFGMLYVHNYGEIRLFIFIGMILGALLYLLTLSVLVMRMSTYIIEQIRKFIIYTIKILAVPVNYIISVIMLPIRKLIAHNQKLVLYKHRKKQQLKRQYYYYKSNKRVEKKIKRDINTLKKTQTTDK